MDCASPRSTSHQGASSGRVSVTEPNAISPSLLPSIARAALAAPAVLDCDATPPGARFVPCPNTSTSASDNTRLGPGSSIRTYLARGPLASDARAATLTSVSRAGTSPNPSIPSSATARPRSNSSRNAVAFPASTGRVNTWVSNPPPPRTRTKLSSSNSNSAPRCERHATGVSACQSTPRRCPSSHAARSSSSSGELSACRASSPAIRARNSSIRSASNAVGRASVGLSSGWSLSSVWLKKA